jgi:hypothetical protein
MGGKANLTGWALLDLEAIGAATVEATLQLLLVGEQFYRPDRQRYQADEENPGGDVHSVSMPLLSVRPVHSRHS